jgi:hypothetical protein
MARPHLTMRWSEHEVIESVRRAREEEVRFFSSPAKAERERWVVGEFLTRLGVEFGAEELQSQPENGIVDVVFRSARFQIKEISDPTDRRHARIKESLRRARQATTVRDLIQPIEARDMVLADITDLLFDIVRTDKYSPRDKSQVDLLVYVTRPHAGFNEPYHSAASRLKSLAWRSISCLFGQKPLVLVETANSPPFLCQRPNQATQRTAPRSDA